MTKYLLLAAIPAAYLALWGYAVVLDRMRLQNEQRWDWESAPSLRIERVEPEAVTA